ncbi:mycofactocin biosynthesis peptidyl-dipeptidase MftE [Gordonia shandongensis]|uniref:mycofactocin biosynthesis peptidyl-dipeptidase MftE n=1 Tax=Gordonia shandongensis TaxID=376351 RepID=UPI0004799A6B|nr:mycofactocin biosynthesis peptidyl-dipeptidase MftE [Gordonia shandongensis]
MRPASDVASRAWPDLVGESPTVVVPVGAVEQHGPHLPLDTDARIATEVVRRAAADAAVLAAPAIAYGASGEHEGFPGTISIGTDALHHLLVEFGRSAMRWAGRIVFVNAHGGNARPLADAVALLRYEGRDAAWFPCTFPSADAHAGATETSVLLALSPDDVRTDLLAPGNTAPVAELLDELRAGGVAAVAPSGVLGDPTAASADTGRAHLDTLVARLRQSLLAWTVADDGRLR